MRDSQWLAVLSDSTWLSSWVKTLRSHGTRERVEKFGGVAKIVMRLRVESAKPLA